MRVSTAVVTAIDWLVEQIVGRSARLLRAGAAFQAGSGEELRPSPDRAAFRLDGFRNPPHRHTSPTPWRRRGRRCRARPPPYPPAGRSGRRRRTRHRRSCRSASSSSVTAESVAPGASATKIGGAGRGAPDRRPKSVTADRRRSRRKDDLDRGPGQARRGTRTVRADDLNRHREQQRPRPPRATRSSRRGRHAGPPPEPERPTARSQRVQRQGLAHGDSFLEAVVGTLRAAPASPHAALGQLHQASRVNILVSSDSY